MKKEEAKEINQKKRDEKKEGKEISNELNDKARKATNKAAAQESRLKKKGVQKFCEDTLTEIKDFCLRHKEQFEVCALILGLME